jgi:TonB family protein
VAVEERVVTEGGKTRSVQVPVEMPEGVRHEGVFGMQPGAGGIGGGYGGGVVGGVAGGVVGGIVPGVAPAPIKIGGQIQESKPIRRVEPEYPALARRNRIEGTVMLEANVDEAGNVTGIRILRSQPLLDAAAIAAVRQWKYAPTLLNGSPVPVVVTVTVPFKLGPDSRLDPAIARLIALVNSGGTIPATQFNFVRGGKAEVMLTIDVKAVNLREQLNALGFEVLTWTSGSTEVKGRIPVAKVPALLKIDAIHFIAPRGE